MRVLVVENNPVSGSALVAFLRERGHSVEWAVGVDEAETKSSVLRPDAIILDLNLGDWRTPRQVLEAARQLPGGGHILILTAMAEADLPPLRDSTKLVKPADPDEIAARLEGLLTEPRTQDVWPSLPDLRDAGV